MKNFNLYFVEYAINSLLRQKYKTIFIMIIFTILTFLLTSVFFITNSMKYELDATLEALPKIIVQQTQAGRVVNIQTQKVDKILNIDGVSDAIARVWGFYKFQKDGVYFTLVGIDPYEEQYKNSLKDVASRFDIDKPSMIVGSGVKKVLDENYYKKYYNFLTPDGVMKKIYISGVFHNDTKLESNDMIVMSKENLREIFGISDDMATDIVVSVPNPKEVNMVSLKLKNMFPNSKITTQDDMKISYENIFNYKSGVFLALFIISIFTFFIIIYDKMSGMSSEEKREIGILKALGWRIDDVLKEKFYEASIISFISYLLGVIFAITYVYLFKAPILKDIFLGYSSFKPAFDLVFVFDIETLALVFFLSVPIYLSATIFPAWRVATIDADEVMR